MSEHNSLLCGGELHDNLFLILSQLSRVHILIPSWQLAVSMHQIGSLICNKHDKLMVKMTILFLLCKYTTQILSDADSCSAKEIQKVVCSIDREKSFSRCVEKAPYIAEITSRGGSWTKIWDSALHLGSKHLRGLQNLARLMAHHGNGIKPCPLCEMEGDDIMPPLLDHVLSSHHIEIGLQAISQSPLTVDNLITRLVESDIRFVYKFWRIFEHF